MLSLNNEVSQFFLPSDPHHSSMKHCTGVLAALLAVHPALMASACFHFTSEVLFGSAALAEVPQVLGSDTRVNFSRQLLHEKTDSPAIGDHVACSVRISWSTHGLRVVVFSNAGQLLASYSLPKLAALERGGRELPIVRTGCGCVVEFGLFLDFGFFCEMLLFHPGLGCRTVCNDINGKLFYNMK